MQPFLDACVPNLTLGDAAQRHKDTQIRARPPATARLSAVLLPPLALGLKTYLYVSDRAVY